MLHDFARALLPCKRGGPCKRRRQRGGSWRWRRGSPHLNGFTTMRVDGVRSVRELPRYMSYLTAWTRRAAIGTPITFGVVITWGRKDPRLSAALYSASVISMPSLMHTSNAARRNLVPSNTNCLILYSSLSADDEGSSPSSSSYRGRTC